MTLREPRARRPGERLDGHVKGGGALALLPRCGLSCEEAAAYIGLGATKFLELVGEGKMPDPLRVGHRTIWDIRQLDQAFDALREEQAELARDVDDGWRDAAP